MSDSQRKPRYILRPVVTPVAGAQPTKSAASKSEASSDPFLRPAQEDDDGSQGIGSPRAISDHCKARV